MSSPLQHPACMPVPDRDRVQLPGLSSRAYEHPTDRSALTALRKIPVAPTLLRRLAALFSERRLRLIFLSSAVRVGENQFPLLHELRNQVASTLDMPEIPELYVATGAHPNAMTLGIDRPFIVLNSASVDLFDRDELRFVIGHEMGHALSGHALYTSVLFTLMRLSSITSSIPLGSWGLVALVHALKEWFRKSELSADRAGLLAAQDIAASRRVHMKLAAGAHLDDMNAVDFVHQGEEYLSRGDALDGVARLLNLLDTTHPFSAVRAVELGRWVGGGDYDRILSGDYPRRDDDPQASVTADVRAAAGSYRDTWERSEVALSRTLRDVRAGAADVMEQGAGWLRDLFRDPGPDGGR